jgi:hemolysin III
MTEVLADTRRVARSGRAARVLARVTYLEPMPVPRLRGLSHEISFAFAPAFGLLLVAAAEGARASAGAVVYAVTMTLMLGVSALNHRAAVPGCWLPRLRRLDHVTVNLFMAGTWTAFALVLGSGALTSRVTAVVWGGAVVASLVTIAWVRVPGWIPAAIMTAAAWSAGVALPDLGAALGPGGLALVLLGASAYMAGAVVYALRRPNPLPASFGYHEVFHALVVVGVVCHYLALAGFGGGAAG